MAKNQKGASEEATTTGEVVTQTATEVIDETTSTETEKEVEQEFDTEAFFKKLDEEDGEKPAETEKEVVRHPLDILMEQDPLTAAFTEWRYSNPQGDMAEFLQEVGYNQNVNTEDLISEETKSYGKRKGWSKEKIEQAIEIKLEKYRELDGIEKEMFDDEIAEKIKPKTGKYQEYVETVKQRQQAQQKEYEGVQKIQHEAEQAIVKKINDVVGTKYLDVLPIPAEDKEVLIALAFKYSAVHADVDKQGKLKGFNVQEIVKDTLMNKYGKQAMKAMVTIAQSKAKVTEIKKQIRPEEGSSKATMFAGTKSKADALREAAERIATGKK